MKLVPLNEFLRDVQQQQFALQSSAGQSKMRGRRMGESAETSTATTQQCGVGKAGSVSRPTGSKKTQQQVARIMSAVKSQVRREGGDEQEVR